MENFQRNPINVQHLILQSATNSIEAPPKRKRKKILSSEAREVVVNVLQMCTTERAKDGLLKPLNEFTARAAIYTGISEDTLEDLKTRDFSKPKECPEPKKSGPKKKKQANDKTVLTDRDIVKIKDIVRDYYIKYCKVPSIKELLPCVLDQIPIYENNVKFLKTVLYNIGYRRKKLFSKQTVLLEDPVAISCRDEYLKIIRRLRNQMKNVYYVYECIIDSSYTFYKSWVQKFSNNDVLQDERTYVLICAASTNGFLKNTTMVWKSHFTDGSNGHFMSTLFEKWLKGHLIPHVPENSIIIMDDAPHHCAIADKPLSYCANKQEMIEYLKKKKIKFDETMRHIELYQLIEDNAPNQKIYIVDDILKEHQHKTLRLPPYMVDLNPAQLAMDKVQQELYESDYSGAFKLKNVTEIIVQLMTAISQEDWDTFFQKTQCLEDDYWKKDGEFEIVMDRIFQNLKNSENSESDKSSVESEDDDKFL